MDINYLKQYSEEAAEDLVKKFFSNKPFINGESILDFCAFEQVNFFILKSLFGQWKEEVKQLRSPYFDFENTSVQNSLKEFMESLSYHIKVEEKHFRPLVISAIEETLLLAIDHAAYFEHEILDKGEFVEREQIENLDKYIKLDFKTPGALKKFVKEKNTDTILTDELKPVLKNLLKDENLDREEIFDHINDLYPLDIVQLIGSKAIENNDISEEIVLEDKISLNELHKIEDPLPSLKDKLSDKKSFESLKTAFNLNQRFKFIKKLFDSNENLFAEAIEKVDEMESQEEAISYLKETYAKNCNWGDEDDIVEEFFSIINRKFMG